jgi:hypothetical protein
MTEQEKFVRCFAAYLMGDPTKVATVAVRSPGKVLRLMVDFQYKVGKDKRPILNILQSMINERDIEYIFGDDGQIIDDE